MTNAPIVQVCDAGISGALIASGARREIVAKAYQTLNDLEQLAHKPPGVTRLMPSGGITRYHWVDKIDDKQTESLSGEIAEEDEVRMTYPGQN